MRDRARPEPPGDEGAQRGRGPVGDPSDDPHALPGEAVPPQQMQAVLAAILEQRSVSGPLPPPEVLAGYREIDPSFPERAFAMAERQAAHRQHLERLTIERGARRADWGVAAGFVLGMSGLAAATITILTGHDAAGGTIGGLALTELVGTFVFGTISRRQEREEKAERLQGR